MRFLLNDIVKRQKVLKTEGAIQKHGVEEFGVHRGRALGRPVLMELKIYF